MYYFIAIYACCVSWHNVHRWFASSPLGQGRLIRDVVLVGAQGPRCRSGSRFGPFRLAGVPLGRCLAGQLLGWGSLVHLLLNKILG